MVPGTVKWYGIELRDSSLSKRSLRCSYTIKISFSNGEMNRDGLILLTGECPFHWCVLMFPTCCLALYLPSLLALTIDKCGPNTPICFMPLIRKTLKCSRLSDIRAENEGKRQ